jgi:hypothetical protein
MALFVGGSQRAREAERNPPGCPPMSGQLHLRTLAEEVHVKLAGVDWPETCMLDGGLPTDGRQVALCKKLRLLAERDADKEAEMLGKLDAELLRLQLHDVSPPPPLNLFADARCADALAAVLERGFSVPQWGEVWNLRAVSRDCYLAVHNDDLWKQMYGRLSAGKMDPPPPHIRSLLALGKATLAEQMRQRPGLRIGAHFEAFRLGQREEFRVKPTAADLQELVFYGRAKSSASTRMQRELYCPYWRGEQPARNVFMPDGTHRVTGNPNMHGAEGLVGRWCILDDPHGCVGSYVCTVANGSHHLYEVRRLPSWNWLLTSPVAFKCSAELASRTELAAIAREEEAASLVPQQARRMRTARGLLNEAAKGPAPEGTAVANQPLIGV